VNQSGSRINQITVQEVVARVPGWATAANCRITPLAGGITNENYRVDVDGRAFVVRIGGEGTALLGIDRTREQAATAAAAGLGVGPELVFALPEAAVLVTRFIDGRGLEAADVHDPATLDRIVEALGRVHRGPSIPGRFSAFRTVESYRDVALAHGVVVPPALPAWLDLARRIEGAAPPDPAVPCHNDLLPANFIDDGARIRILDWEYAAMGDAYFDLGNLAANAELGPAEERRLLELYGGDATPRALARLGVMRLASDLREAMWGLVQIGISRLTFDFAGYAARHFARVADRADRATTWLS
jgi:thiamine kinase-like enzyme